MQSDPGPDRFGPPGTPSTGQRALGWIALRRGNIGAAKGGIVPFCTSLVLPSLAWPFLTGGA